MPGELAARTRRNILRHPGITVPVLILAALVCVAVLAPLLAPADPSAIDPVHRNRPPGTTVSLLSAEGADVRHTYWMGSDTLGRDVCSRVIYGTRVSLLIGFAVAGLASLLGIVLGLLAGFVRRLDGPVMRIMDGLMAIPAILLALGLVAVWGASLGTVVLAIVIPEVPRMTRIVRAVTLTIREEPYVEAAKLMGTPASLVMIRHVLPNALTPIVIQASFVAASAILIEASLGFLGVGIPPETPTWGNIMAEGRTLFRVMPHNIFFPALLLSATVLAINVLGDTLRDRLDPRLERAS